MTFVEPTREQVLEFCARAPVERVFLEDVARRGLGRFVAVAEADGALGALCHVGANLVPSGEGCGAFADAAAESRSRMIIGEARRGHRAVGRGARRAAGAARGPAAPARLRDHGAAASRRRPACAPATAADLERLLPACAAAHELELGLDPLARDPDGVPLAHGGADRRGPLVALARGRRRALQGGGLRLDAVGRPDPAGVGRPGSARARLRRAAGCAISAACCSRRRRS